MILFKLLAIILCKRVKKKKKLKFSCDSCMKKKKRRTGFIQGLLPNSSVWPVWVRTGLARHFKTTWCRRVADVLILYTSKAVCDVCYQLLNIIFFLFTQVDLAAIIHKCVPVHGIHFIPRFCLQNPSPSTDQPPRAHPSGRTPEFGYGPLQIFLIYVIYSGISNCKFYPNAL